MLGEEICGTVGVPFNTKMIRGVERWALCRAVKFFYSNLGKVLCKPYFVQRGIVMLEQVWVS